VETLNQNLLKLQTQVQPATQKYSSF